VLECSSGTYVRTLAQDFGRLLGSVALLQSLTRTGCGPFRLREGGALRTAEIAEQMAGGCPWDELPCWVPFDQLLCGYERVHATQEEAAQLMQGRSAVLFGLLKRVEPPARASVPETAPEPAASPGPGDEPPPPIAIFCGGLLIAVARRDGETGTWGLERVFKRGEPQ
jgi:tRNA U55 pseudouridine synthase TruB